MILSIKGGGTHMKPIEIKGVKIGEGMPKICVPIVGITREDILEQARQIKNSFAELVEWRVDWYAESSNVQEVKKVLGLLRDELPDHPIIFTFRTKAEGGEKEISFAKYVELLQEIACTNKVDFIDIEVFKDCGIRTLICEIQEQGVKVIGSNHDFVKTPEKKEIIRRLCYMQELGVDIPKIAVMPCSEEDVTILLEATREMSSRYAKCPIVTMSMGKLGMVSRVEGEKYGSAMTFGTIGKASAPGQIPIEELKSMLEKIHCIEKQ